MAKSKQFGSMLKDAIYHIKSKESNKSIQTIQDELGYALGKKGHSAIEYWRQGNIPMVTDLENLTREIIKRTDFDQDWIKNFLESGKHPHLKQFIDELFPTYNPSSDTHVSIGINPKHDMPTEKAVKEALSQWTSTNYRKESSFSDIYLYRKALQEGARNPRQATNQILISAHRVLEKIHNRDAQLIQMRFFNEWEMNSIASQFHVGSSTLYAMRRAAIRRLTKIIQEQEYRARIDLRTMLYERVPSATYESLVGMDVHIDKLGKILIQNDSPWILSVEGIGGIGKTSLVHALVNHLIEQCRFEQVGWVSARQYHFDLMGEIEEIEGPALRVEVMINELIRQLMPDYSSTIHLPLTQRVSMLRQHLKQTPHLIVIDNLETIVDVQSLLPTLKQLANPTRFVLTSRQRVSGESQVYHFKVPELDESSVLRLIRQDARESNLLALADCTDSELRPIYETVGGNPLAIRLVVGQIHLYPLQEVLQGFREAQGKTVDEFYTFIYKQAWEKLDILSQEVFLLMSQISEQGEDLGYLIEISGRERDQLYTVLNRLILLSLVDARGGVHERLYKIHNLTRAFLYKQVLKW